MRACAPPQKPTTPCGPPSSSPPPRRRAGQGRAHRARRSRSRSTSSRTSWRSCDVPGSSRAAAAQPAAICSRGPPEEISLADVIRAVEGPLANVRGMSPDALEYEGSAERLRDVWVALRASVRARARAGHARRRREGRAAAAHRRAHARRRRLGPPLTPAALQIGTWFEPGPDSRDRSPGAASRRTRPQRRDLVRTRSRC